MSGSSETCQIYVGTDRSQLLAVKVLEHSIRRHTELPIRLTPMLDLPLPEPKDPRQGKRTGFSFSRFAIPQLAGYEGRALYLDADMLVFKDIASLWNIPFAGAKVVIQEEIEESHEPRKLGAPAKRIKQCSVMLLDCARLDWDPAPIIAGLDGRYTYEELVYQLCILQPDEIRTAIPFEWNSLESWTPATGLIHYTDMYTQPWASPENRWGFHWLNEVKLMLSTGALAWSEIEEEIGLGYFRPSLATELRLDTDLGVADPQRVAEMLRIDRDAGFVKHKAVYEAKRRREQAIRDYERASGGLRPVTRLIAGPGSAPRALVRGVLRAIGLRP